MATPINVQGTLTNAGTLVVFDTTYGLISAPSASAVGPFRGRYRDLTRISVFVYPSDQAVTVYHDVLMPGSSTWRTVNGSGSGESVTAGDTADFDFATDQHDHRVRIVAGATAPAALEVGCKLIHNDRSSGS